ncbi:hypothetical protein [Brevundimonas aurifodinae]|uniref:Uncharacterized protein n=2 Tax=Brevundimonas TaxID=41275 RepID=A0ABV1NLZ7_9CAUL|nr:MAG: hypothetical protein B7Z42_08555 [Brevundimonas sp. 12-68-7]OYX32438.1 MAG: hypothetical protein B7Z01_11000 [Brevundimonas subvibrioides]
MRIGLFPRFASTLALVAGVALSPAVATAEGTGTYYDRAFVLAADRKCRLFAAPVAGALSAATLQAHGAALRAGTAETALRETAARARARAASVSCANPELGVVRDRVAHAFDGWARTPRMTFPGSRAAWAADRMGSDEPGWRLMQASVTGASPVTFGLAADPEGVQALSAVVSFVGQPRPYAARIVMRDPALSPRPWLTAAGIGVLPPESQRRTVWSAGTDMAAPTLLTEGRRQGEAWRFPDAGAERLAALDPREPFLIQFLFRDGSIATARFEAGDFAAARAFVALGTI